MSSLGKGKCKGKGAGKDKKSKAAGKEESKEPKITVEEWVATLPQDEFTTAELEAREVFIDIMQQLGGALGPVRLSLIAQRDEFKEKKAALKLPFGISVKQWIIHRCADDVISTELAGEAAVCMPGAENLSSDGGYEDFFNSLPADDFTQDELALRDYLLASLESRGGRRKYGEIRSDPDLTQLKQKVLPKGMQLSKYIERRLGADILEDSDPDGGGTFLRLAGVPPLSMPDRATSVAARTQASSMPARTQGSSTTSRTQIPPMTARAQAPSYPPHASQREYDPHGEESVKDQRARAEAAAVAFFENRHHSHEENQLRNVLLDVVSRAAPLPEFGGSATSIKLSELLNKNPAMMTAWQAAKRSFLAYSPPIEVGFSWWVDHRMADLVKVTREPFVQLVDHRPQNSNFKRRSATFSSGADGKGKGKEKGKGAVAGKGAPTLATRAAVRTSFSKMAPMKGGVKRMAGPNATAIGGPPRKVLRQAHP
jgi:hypothetical protein